MSHAKKSKLKLGHLTLALAAAIGSTSGSVVAQTTNGELKQSRLDALVTQAQNRVSDYNNRAVSTCVVQEVNPTSTEVTQIFVRVNKLVTLTLPPDEQLTQLNLDEPKKGANVDLLVDGTGRVISLKLKINQTVNGVIHSNKSSRFFALVPSDPDTAAPCYLGVLFSPDKAANDGTFNPFGYTGKAAASSPTTMGETVSQARPGDDVFTGAPNFNYTIEGVADFKPLSVYDNGKFTWVQMPPAAQQLPAVFMVGANGEELVNYTPINNGNTIIINRLMDRFVLRISDRIVTVTATGAKK